MKNKRRGTRKDKTFLVAEPGAASNLEDYVTEKLIVESGRDVEGRLIFAFYGCRFPDPQGANYDELLDACMKRLEEYVRNDYVVVLFAEPLHNSPSLGWMIDAYKRLSRNYKKNVKRLYIVHSSWWFKAVLGFMQKVVSSKFAAKIELVNQLSSLPDLVPCENIDILDEIEEYDDKVNKPGDTHVKRTGTGEAMTSKSANKRREGRRKEKLFGKNLSIVSAGSIGAPSPIISLITYLKENALDEDGLFRKSAPSGQINDLKERLDKDLEVQWSKFDPATLAGLLKAYVRELPKPLIPPSTYINLSELSRIEGKVAGCQYVRQSFIDQMDKQSVQLLREIIDLLRETLNHSARNRMSMKSLTTVWTPNLIRHEDASEELRRLDASKRLIALMIENYDDLF